MRKSTLLNNKQSIKPQFVIDSRRESYTGLQRMQPINTQLYLSTMLHINEDKNDATKEDDEKKVLRTLRNLKKVAEKNVLLSPRHV